MQFFLEIAGENVKMNKKNTFLIVAAAFCLTVAMFAVIPSWSSSGGYDPWLDLNDDGRIDMKDVAAIAHAFGATGTPVNKTVLLINVNDTYTQLMNELANMRSLMDQLNVTSLLNRLDNLQNQVDAMNFTKMSRLPDRDSGWLYFPQNSSIIYEHDLSTTNVLVYMIGNSMNGTSPYIHQKNYGEDNSGLSLFGAAWYDLTNTTIRLHRGATDVNWNYVRVMLWRLYP